MFRSHTHTNALFIPVNASYISHHIKTLGKGSFKLLKLFFIINFCSTSNSELLHHP